MYVFFIFHHSYIPPKGTSLAETAHFQPLPG